MTNPYRAMCAELPKWAERTSSHYYIQPDVIARARALLAEQPVSPPYTLPEPVAHQDKLDRLIALDRAQPEPEGPTDDEIEEWADDCSEAPLEEMYPEIHGWRRCFTAKEFSETIRAAIARWGCPAAARLRYCPTHGQQPPEAWGCPDCVRELREELAASLHPTSAVEGEVAELVAWLLREADYQEITCKRYPCADRIRRAAALLERLASPACYVLDPSPEALASYKAADPGIIEALPAELTVLPPLAQPVAVSERLPGPEDCDAEGRYWGLVLGCEAWALAKGNPRLLCITHWLPANALPTPEAL